MSRILNLVRLDADNIPVAGCSGSCHQGHSECDCELAAWIPLDPCRPFPAPPARAPSRRGRRRAGAVLAIALIAAGLVVLLAPRPVHSATLIVLVGPR